MNILESLKENIRKADKSKVKYLVGALEEIFDTTEPILDLLGISEDKLKKLTSRHKIKLDAILKKLFQSSPLMFLGTIGYLNDTNYREQYVIGKLKDEDIIFMPVDFIRETLRFDVLHADSFIKIKDNIYQIEFQTSNDNMAIRFARYGLEYGIANKVFDETNNIYKIIIPEQSVIFLEKNKENTRNNSYELFWRNKKLERIEVKVLKLWEIDIEDVLNNKLYNLLPILIFKYRLNLINAKGNKLTLEEVKNEFLLQSREILKKAIDLNREIREDDIDIIISVLGELVNYFDETFFENSIRKEGEFEMTFTEQINSYRQQINTARKEKEQVEMTLNNYKQQINTAQQEKEQIEMTFTEQINSYRQQINTARKEKEQVEMTFIEQINDYKQQINDARKEKEQVEVTLNNYKQQINILKQKGLQKGEIKGKVEMLYKEFEYEFEEIASKLQISVEEVRDIISNLEKEFYNKTKRN
ncbi:hypothetical protein AN639_09130 [Candidatus Epulonipiscium fishelsonii]|uniref:Uncharacterized protein n=1 Tax=Candidatus Epulonipiscium fishelsonii TaxID=77094 RepID=A0ACC8XDK3_9FIRM|nr:hypothetical protein AN639_09130 [Epulopiscium sp. SCG-B05WGA-EpuloA1]ONI41009.1 hypothetical protein AN396_04415 [Epulopiscium sp. SCG-B11WGA-EpuloA1]